MRFSGGSAGNARGGIVKHLPAWRYVRASNRRATARKAGIGEAGAAGRASLERGARQRE